MGSPAAPRLFMSQLRIVLVGTQHPGNIGSAARAMRTMGLSELVLVAPEATLPHPEATALAAGADALLASAPIHADVAAAVADCRLVMGCTARSRSVPMPELSPRVAARQLLQASGEGPVALLFGRERTGLSNDELQLCQAAVHIPSVSEFSSLNLAASVQVLAYELRLAALEACGDGGEPDVPAAGGSPPAPGRVEPPATHAELEGMFDHLLRTLDDIDFHKGRSPDTVMRRLRRLFLRAAPDQREVRIVRGILADMQRIARLSGIHRP